jgi:hypothetical protein
MNRALLLSAIALSANLIFARAQTDNVTSGGIYSIEGGFSEPAMPAASGGSYTVENGSFNPILTVETPNAPTLKIQHQGANIIITWSAPLDSFQIEQTTALTAAWSQLTATQQAAGAEIRVTVPISAQNQFLRLKKAAP